MESDAYSALHSFLDTPAKVEARRGTHPYCQECLKGCSSKNYIGSQVERRKRDFVIERGDPDCKGVYSQEDIVDGFNYLQAVGFHEITFEDVKSWLNPSYWLKTNVSLKGQDFDPYWYQDRCLRCTAEKKVLRMSRRAGKSAMLAAHILYMLFNAPTTFFKMLVICPTQTQAKEIWDNINNYLESNPVLQDSVKFRQTPYFEAIVVATKCGVRIFTAGSKSGNKALGVRGQGANELIMDEMDYLEEDDITTITPILTDAGGGRFLGASTLKGTETLFYKYCHTTKVKEFYVPFRARPDWNLEKEMDARDTSKTELAFDLEYNVIWVGKLDGVFQRSYVLGAMNTKKYHYRDMFPKPDWTYYIGVDWNGNNNGTRIVLTGYNPADNCLYVVSKEIVAYKDWTQVKALQRIIELNRVWRPELIVIDHGFGQAQDEILRGYGMGSEAEYARGSAPVSPELMADIRLKDIIEVVDFGGNIIVPNLYTKKDEQFNAKNYLIENLQRMFEQGAIRLAQDEDLKEQLLEYVVLKYSNKGYPVYKGGLAGDHDLDALALSAFGFAKTNHREFQKSPVVTAVGIANKALEALKAEEPEAHPATEKEEKRDKSNKTSNAMAGSVILPEVATNHFKKIMQYGNIDRSIGYKQNNPLSIIFKRGIL